jgi:hypothetical protein
MTGLHGEGEGPMAQPSNTGTGVGTAFLTGGAEQAGNSFNGLIKAIDVSPFEAEIGPPPSGDPLGHGTFTAPGQDDDPPPPGFVADAVLI